MFAVDSFSGYHARCAHVFEYPKLNTFTVGGDFIDPFSSAITASTQLAPVYKPGGGGPTPEIVDVTPTVKALLAGGRDPIASFFTKTVYGFLDFTTTVGSTVMIFTPQSQVAKLKPSKTTAANLPPRSSRFTLPPPRSRPTPTPTIPKLKATAAPQTNTPKLPVLASSTLESSFLAIETLFSVTPEAPHNEEDFIIESSPVQEFPEETAKPRQTPQKRPVVLPPRRKQFNRPNKNFDIPPGSRRPDPIFFRDRKKPVPARQSNGGSTIVPITIEGTGTLTPKFTIPEKQQESTIPSIPSEVVVSATQGFALLSVIEPVSSVIKNEIDQASEHYDFLASEPPLDVEEKFDVYEVESDFLHKTELVSSDSMPTGLVTELGGTIVSDGHTTVHLTSVIGTYIEGKYAQILQSTSHIFQITPTPELKLDVPQTAQTFKTVKSVIAGSATQFITPSSTTVLPIESLFTPNSSGVRDDRSQADDGSLIQKRLQSAFLKRGGPQHEAEAERFQHEDDPYVDLEEENQDLQRAGSNLRPSYRFQGASVKPTQPVSTFYAQEVKPTTFRRSFKPSTTRRFGNNRPATSRPGPPGTPRQKNRWRVNTSPRPKVNINRRPITPGNRNRKQQQQVIEETNPEPVLFDDSDIPGANALQEETLNIVTNTPADGANGLYYEMATIRSLHTFRVGTTKNTRYVTFTKTFTHGISSTVGPSLPQDELYETRLFENILDEGPQDVSTLPPIDLGDSDVTALLETITETFSTTEIMMKTSVLPVLQAGETSYYSLTQTYHITRVVTALKTVPPYEAFSFIPENSLNEFNDQLLAEGTETGQSLNPGELEYDENGEVVDTAIGTRVRPPPGFPFQDPNLADLAGGPFNPDAFEKQHNPELSAALQQRQQLQQQQSNSAPQLSSGQPSTPVDPALATPGLSPEQLQQLVYMRLLNPYSFGGFPNPLAQQQQQTTVTSSPVTVTTDITTTSTRVLRIIFNNRPIFTTLSSVEVVHTTLTTYATQTVTASPNLSPFSFPFAPAPFPVG